jgi:hypothetical protein
VEGIEECEPRLAPAGFSWSGNGDGITWSDERNWDQMPGSGLYPKSKDDWANFNASAMAQNVTCTVSTLGGLNINNPNLTLTLADTLTVQGGGAGDGCGNFNMNAGSIVPSGTATNLILDDIGGADAHGGPSIVNGAGANVPVIGSASYNNTFILQDGSKLNVTGTVDVYSYINVSFGDSSGKTNVLDLQGGTLTLMQNTPNNSNNVDPNSNNITVGTRGILKIDGANETIAATNDDGGENNAFIDISGGLMTVQVRGTTSSTTTTVPVKLEAAQGRLDVESHNGLLINAAGTTLTFALEVEEMNRAQIGLQNPGDTGPGSAGIACSQAGAQIDSGGELRIIGASNTFSTPSTGTNSLRVLGLLTLELPGDGTTWVPSNLTITNGDISFGGSSTFSFWGKADSSAYDSLTVTSGSVLIYNGASVVVNVWGDAPPEPSNYKGVITDTAGGGNGIFALNGGTGFSMPAGWTSNYEGGPPTNQMDVWYTG